MVETVRRSRVAHRGHGNDRPAAVVDDRVLCPPRAVTAVDAAATASTDCQQRLSAPRTVGETRMGQKPAVVTAAGRRTRTATSAWRPRVAGQHEPAVSRPGDAAEATAWVLPPRQTVHAVLATAVQERTRTRRPRHHVQNDVASAAQT